MQTITATSHFSAGVNAAGLRDEAVHSTSIFGQQVTSACIAKLCPSSSLFRRGKSVVRQP